MMRRLSRPSLRLRTLMVLVALVALGMGGYAEYRRLRRLGQEYQGRAAEHDLRGRDLAGSLALGEDMLGDAQYDLVATEEFYKEAKTDEDLIRLKTDDRRAEIAKMERMVEGFRDLAAYHAEMASKYRRAAARPWLPVAPDPPEPPEPQLPFREAHPDLFELPK